MFVLRKTGSMNKVSHPDPDFLCLIRGVIQKALGKPNSVKHVSGDLYALNTSENHLRSLPPRQGCGNLVC